MSSCVVTRIIQTDLVCSGKSHMTPAFICILRCLLRSRQHQCQPGNPSANGQYSMAPPATFDCFTYGATFSPASSAYTSTPKEGFNPHRQVYEWYAFILYAPVQFSSDIIWKTSGDWSGTCPHMHGDAKTVAAHETAHTIGLGHTWKAYPGTSNPYPSVMHQGPIPWEVYQPDDKAGIEDIYHGDQQNS